MNVPTRSVILPQYAGVRVLLLGSTGFIGRWVGRLLTEARADLVCGVRDPDRAEDRLGTFGVGGDRAAVDLGDQRQVRRLVERIVPTVVFNCAGYGVLRDQTDPVEANRTNAVLPGLLADLVPSFGSGWGGTRFVHTGSAAEYGNAGGSLDEDGPTSPISLYGESKLQGTLAVVRPVRESMVVARLFTVYGAGEDPARLLPSLLRSRGGTAPIPLTAGTQHRDFTHVEEVAEGLLRIGCRKMPPGTVINLASGQLTSVRSFVERAATVLGIPRSRLEFGALPTRADEMEHRPVSNHRCRRALEWVPSRSIEDGVRLTAEP